MMKAPKNAQPCHVVDVGFRDVVVMGVSSGSLRCGGAGDPAGVPVAVRAGWCSSIQAGGTWSGVLLSDTAGAPSARLLGEV
ncbi:MAG: hypothetical protein ACXWLP_12850 [Myxococcaceae bacterium]